MLCGVLAGDAVEVGRAPAVGEAVPVARWRHRRGVGAVLFIRRRRDGAIASEICVATRDAAGRWADLEQSSGSCEYPDPFSGAEVASSAGVLGVSEMWIGGSDMSDGEGVLLRLAELSLGGSVDSLSCESSLSREEQEVGPLGVSLVGVLGEGAAIVRAYAGRGEVFRFVMD